MTMDDNLFVVDNRSDPVEDARAAGTAIARARHEVRRRVGEFLVNAVDDEELIQRLAYRDVDQAISEASERHLGAVSDGKAKLARSLVREVHARWEAIPMALFITKEGGLRLGRDYSESERENMTTYKDTNKFPIKSCKDVSNAYHRLHQTNEDKAGVKKYIDGQNAKLGCGIDSEAKAGGKTARDQITCPNCHGQGCTECEWTGQIDDDKRPGGTADHRTQSSIQFTGAQCADCSKCHQGEKCICSGDCNCSCRKES